MSSVSPSRLSGYTDDASSSRPTYSASANFVFTTAGATAFTRMSGPSSRARVSVRLISAALLAP